MEINIKGYTVLVDEEDLPLLNKYSWRVCKKEEKQGLLYFHAPSPRDPVTYKQQDFRMHRLIMGCTVGDGVVVDHINHNTLDNRKCNLRKTTPAGNTWNMQKGTRNTSGYKGVSYFKRDSLYQAGIKCNGKCRNIGRRETAEEAARLYDLAAIVLFGEHACLNFDRTTYSQEEIDKMKEYIPQITYCTNTSGYRGVSYNAPNNKWSASIQKDKVQYYLGLYSDPETAARVRDKKALELLGDKAKLNFPKESYIKESINE